MSKKVILVSHGKLAEGMLYSAKMIVGENESVSAMGMLPGEHYQPMVDEIERQLKEDENTQIIVVADLLGGSVCNGMMSLLQYPNMKLIAGMNLALVINLVMESQQLTDKQIEGFIQEAKEINIQVAPPESQEDDDFF
jgi:mannose/fructose/sorbose-specific phosphotransferase system IIA component